MAEGHGTTRVLVENAWCFDPVADLPGDLAAICLSFVSVRTLLCHAQRVSRAWNNAIGGGLPAVWHHVIFLRSDLADDALAVVASKSRGNTMSLSSRVSSSGLQHVCAMPSLKVLRIAVNDFSLTPVLPCLSLLEELYVSGSVRPRSARDGIVFPPLPFLTNLSCCCMESVGGLRNLPALTKLKLRYSSMQDDDAWSASLRDVTIFCHKPSSTVFHLIAALQHPVRLATDWSFLSNTSHDPHSSLPSFSTLQHLCVSRRCSSAFFSALNALRELELVGTVTTDYDVQCLTQLTNLQRVKIVCTRLSTHGFRRVCSMPSLTALSMTNCDSIVDYSALQLCSHLQRLSIYFCSQGDTLKGLQAIAELKYLEKLNLCIRPNNHLFSQFGNMRHLHKLHIQDSDVAGGIDPIETPSAVFAYLPLLHYLESIRLPLLDSVVDALDCLVQMPRLRCVLLANRLSDNERSRLRDSLPRLEVLGEDY